MPAPDLYPIPFPTLVSRMARELAAGGDVYALPRRGWWTPGALDLGIDHLGRRLHTPSGPASGPHTQLAQNLVLAWLSGGRFMELKTVQIDDALEIPRPCIHVPHIGYNVEWSQELRVPQSAMEYIKGWVLVHMLAGPQGPGLWSGVGACWDLSLGYDLAGIRSQKVRDFVGAMRDAGEAIAALKAELSGPLARWAEVEVPGEICDSVTLSTFHGCPADEIEAIATQTLEWGLHTVVKLNPTLHGYQRCREILDRLGYDYIALDPHDFEKDLQWSQLAAFVPRLKAQAASRGLTFGVKFSNTLVSRSSEAPFGDETLYTSGAPLHVLAFLLAARFRAELDGEIPVTFSAGVDHDNFWECVASGLGPVTSCSDLLKGGGYARQARYLRKLEEQLEGAGLASVDQLREGAAGRLQERAAGLLEDPRYHREKNRKAPRKIDSHLALLDCLTCDKCVPVCPNAANFTFPVPQGTFTPGAVRWGEGALTRLEGPELIVEKKHQIGNTADVCNLCGQCDVWCPEYDGPYLVKPNLFLSEESFEEHPERDGFVLDEDRGGIRWRRQGTTWRYRAIEAGRARLEAPSGWVELEEDAPVGCQGSGEAELSIAVTMRLFLEAFQGDGESWLG
jgi:putative selenate reductase